MRKTGVRRVSMTMTTSLPAPLRKGTTIRTALTIESSDSSTRNSS